MSVAGLIGCGFAIGAAIQAFRQIPPDAGPLSSSSAWLIVVGALVAGYFAGRRRRGASAVSVATATAESTATAQNHVQVAVVVPGQTGAGARSADAAGLGGVDGLPWVTGPSAAGALEGVDLDDAVQEFARESVAEEA